MSGATGRITSADTEAMANSAAQLITDLDNQPSIDINNPRVIIASDLGAPGPYHVVTGVQVGDVVDTQRRRRNALPEAYTSAPVTVV